MNAVIPKPSFVAGSPVHRRHRSTSCASPAEEIVGRSPALFEVLARVNKVARTNSSILITGETGTGKELIARSIHIRSERSAGPFIAVNCGAIPSSLIASELFGHEKGAFTGALQQRLGRFELAHTGTIFLDEIGELPLERSLIICESETLTIEESCLVPSPALAEAKPRALNNALIVREKEIIERALRESKARVSGPRGAAAKLGLPPSTLESKILSLKINKHQFKSWL